MKNPFEKVHKEKYENTCFWRIVGTDGSVLMFSPNLYTEEEADYLVAAINGFEAAEDKLDVIKKEVGRWTSPECVAFFYQKTMGELANIILAILDEEQK